MKNLSDINFKYYIDYDYDRTSCTGNCDDYCRCSKIINFKVKSVNISDIANLIYENEKDEVTKYVVERILVAAKIYNPDNWDASISYGYYGEEMDSVSLNSSLIKTINKNLKELASLTSDTEKIKLALIAEYGYLLPKINNMTFEYKKVPLDQIYISNDKYQKVGNCDYLLDYNGKFSYDGPLIVGYYNDDKIEVIDGHHRLITYLKTKPAKDKNPKVPVIVGTICK